MVMNESEELDGWALAEFGAFREEERREGEGMVRSGKAKNGAKRNARITAASAGHGHL